MKTALNNRTKFIVLFSLIFLCPPVATAKTDQSLLLHIPKGHEISISISEDISSKSGLTGCWVGRHKVAASKWITDRFELRQKGENITGKSDTGRIYTGRVVNGKIVIRFQAKSVADVIGSEPWHNSDTGQERAAPSMQRGKKIIEFLGELPEYRYELEINDNAHLSGSHHVVQYQHSGEDVIAAHMVDVSSKWERSQNAKVTKLHFVEAQATSGDQITIEANIDSNCAVGLETADALLYPGHDKGKGIKLHLVETSPDSSLLRSVGAVVPAQWSTDYIKVMPMKGVIGAKIPLHSKSGNDVNGLVSSSERKSSRQAVLESQLKQVSTAEVELNSLRQQWTLYSDQIDEQRAKGNDVSDLQKNLMRINEKKQNARKRLVKLNKKYGTPDQLQKEIDALSPAQTPSISSKPIEQSDPPSPDIYIPGIPKASDFGFSGKSKVDKPVKAGDKPINRLSGDSSVSKHAPLAITKRLQTSACWTVYKVKTVSRRADGLPDINVIKVAFKKSTSRAAMIVKSYSVSLVRNANGTTLWSVNWNNSDIEESRMASTPDKILMLERNAEQRKAGAVPKNELDTLIGNTLGPNSRKKK